MFLYAATPDFRSEVISTYRALQDRIGSKAFSPASPMVPLINIEDTNSSQVIFEIGERLLAIFARANEITWDMDTQVHNMKELVIAQEGVLFETPKPRFFVYQYCRFLDQQKDGQRLITDQEASDFVNDHEPPLEGDA